MVFYCPAIVKSMRMKIGLTVLFSLFLLPLCAQTVISKGKVVEEEKRERIIEVAKGVYQRPEYKSYYHIFGTPTVEEILNNEDETDPESLFYGLKKGDVYYVVVFPYDNSKEKWDRDYAAKVFILERKLIPFIIGFRDGDIYLIQELNKL